MIWWRLRSPSFNERIDVSETYPTGTPRRVPTGRPWLFSTLADYHKFAQMLADNGRGPDGRQLIGGKTLSSCTGTTCRPPSSPSRSWVSPTPGWDSASAPAVLLDGGRFAGTGSDGEFGWAGVAKTYYWVVSRRGSGRRVHVAVHDRGAPPRPATSGRWSTRPSSID